MLKFFKLNLFMHDGEAAVSAEGSQTAEGTAEVTAEGGQAESSVVDTEKEYQDLKTKYNKEFKADVQKIIDRRFAKSKEVEARLKEQDGVMNLLHQRYGTKSVQALYEALENDEAYLDMRAEELGMTREQAQLYDKALRDKEVLERQVQEAEFQRQQDAQIQDWIRQAEELKTKYPEFDLQNELQNEAFAAQLKAGVGVELAFKTTHFDELMQATTAYAAQQTQKAVTENIRARGTRPAENGTGTKSGFTTSKDISNMSLKEINEKIERARRGENVTF